MTVPLLHERILAERPEFSDHQAVGWDGGQLSHGELRTKSIQLAHVLAECGVGHGDRVAICMPKCQEAVQSILAILSLGAAYVPIDHQSPPRRILQILADAEPRLTLTTSGVIESLGLLSSDAAVSASKRETTEPSRFITVDHEFQGYGFLSDLRGSDALPDIPIQALDDLAAILYTSGSSGTPKGVQLTHRNISSFVQWAIQRFQFKPDDRFASHAPFHFDLSTLDLFASLDIGASVFLIDAKTVRFPGAVASLIAKQKMTIWYSVPTALRMLCEYGALEQKDMQHLRWVFFAGEVLPIPTLRSLMQKLNTAKFVNFYGPTETNVCTYHEVEKVPESSDTAIPVGVACEHLAVDIYRADGSLAEQDEVGEIGVFGASVTPGYWRNQQLSKSVRLDKRPDSYLTGDLGHRDQSGRLWFHGRNDDQIQFRGHRLQLADIESHLMSHPLVAQAVACVTDADSLESQLIVFVETLEKERPTEEGLRMHCEMRLPPYAVPSMYVLMDRLPLSSNGKVARSALLKTLD